MKRGKRLVGWNDSACLFKKTVNLWYKIWEEAGCPKSGVLFQIKKTTKSRYKYWVDCLKCRQNILLQKKLSLLLMKKNKKQFWSEVCRLNRSSCSYTLVVDGVPCDVNIANLFATKSPTLPPLIHLTLQSFLSQAYVLFIVRCLFQMAMYFRLFLNLDKTNQMEVVFSQST